MNQNWVKYSKIITEKLIYMFKDTIAAMKFIFGTKVGLFSVRFLLVPAGSSIWPKCSGMTTYPLVALFAAVLLRRMK